MQASDRRSASRKEGCRADAAPRMVGKLSSKSETEGADCVAIGDREIFVFHSLRTQLSTFYQFSQKSPWLLRSRSPLRKGIRKFLLTSALVASGHEPLLMSN